MDQHRGSRLGSFELDAARLAFPALLPRFLPPALGILELLQTRLSLLLIYTAKFCDDGHLARPAACQTERGQHENSNRRQASLGKLGHRLLCMLTC